MTTTVYTSLETFNDIVTLLDVRAKLITGKNNDKAKLAKSKASLDMKIQSERYYNTQINAINAKLEGLQGKTIVAA